MPAEPPAFLGPVFRIGVIWWRSSTGHGVDDDHHDEAVMELVGGRRRIGEERRPSARSFQVGGLEHPRRRPPAKM
jgi:hypothetical protein